MGIDILDGGQKIGKGSAGDVHLIARFKRVGRTRRQVACAARFHVTYQACRQFSGPVGVVPNQAGDATRAADLAPIGLQYIKLHKDIARKHWAQDVCHSLPAPPIFPDQRPERSEALPLQVGHRQGVAVRPQLGCIPSKVVAVGWRDMGPRHRDTGHARTRRLPEDGAADCAPSRSIKPKLRALAAETAPR